MNTIFSFTNRNEIYKKCLYASIAHAVMVGKYYLLSEEISWDGCNYLIQNMEGVKAVFAFTKKLLVCAVQNEKDFIGGEKNITKTLLDTSKKELIEVAESEIFPYFLLDDEEASLTAIFWESNDAFLSCIDEKELMKKTDSILLPYLYEMEDCIKYWKNYYEASDEQMDFIHSLFDKRINESNFSLSDSDLQKLKFWFGDNANYCKEAFQEIFF